MSEIKNTKNQDLEALRRYHSDGALDIIIGALLMNLGLDVLNQAHSASLFTWIPIIVFTTIKTRFTIPRITLKKLGVDEAKVRYWATQSAVGLAIGLVLTSMVILSDPLDLQSKLILPWDGNTHSLSFGVVCALGLLAASWLTKLRRFNYYALMVFIVSLVSTFLLPSYAAVFISAIGILVFGFKTMNTFTHQYPDPQIKEKK